MSETGEANEQAQAYYEAAEAAFIRRRGTPFLLSPADFALLKQWHALGVPLEAIEAGIDEAFTRREERSAIGRVNSLSYCRDAVLEAWERRMETARGKGGTGAPTEPDTRATLAELSRRLEQARFQRPELEAPLGSALRTLARLAESGKSSEEIESSLARLDRRLAKELYAALSESERAEIDRQVAGLLSGASARMDPAAADKTARTLTRRSVRERLELPRLSLL